MAIAQIVARLPSVRTSLTIVISGVFGGVIALASLLLLVHVDLPSPPTPHHDPRFVSLGRHYQSHLAAAYAAAWENGATLLDSGRSIASALESVGHLWEANRKQIFEQIVTPEFSKLVPESTNDSDVSPQARAAMSAAWRGFAIGLRK